MAPLTKSALLCMTAYIMPLVAQADLPAVSRHIAASDNPISFPYILQIGISFVAVVAFILFLAWLMKKSGRFGTAGNRGIKVISSLSLGMREKIVLVNVNNVNIVVGVAPGQIRTLHVLAGTIPEEMIGDSDDGFGRLMGKFLK